MGQEQSSVDGRSPKDPRSRTQSSVKSQVSPIVVVSNKIESKPNKFLQDEDIQSLRNAKLYKPILGNNSPGEMAEVPKIPKIISAPLTEMILRYQFHLTECAEAVSFDQTSLSKQIKETDILANKVYKSLNEKHKSFEKAINQIETVYEVSNMLNQIETNMNSVINLFKQVNRQLPTEDQIHDTEFT